MPCHALLPAQGKMRDTHYDLISSFEHLPRSCRFRNFRGYGACHGRSQHKLGRVILVMLSSSRRKMSFLQVGMKSLRNSIFEIYDEVRRARNARDTLISSVSFLQVSGRISCEFVLGMNEERAICEAFC
jgi:hypothetical protein